MYDIKLLDISLSMFEEDAAGAAAASSADGGADVTGAGENGGDAPHNDAGEPNSQGSENGSNEEVDYNAKFDELLADENYKNVYNNRVKNQIDRRSKAFKKLKEENASYAGAIDIAYKKYGVDNVKDLMAKLEDEHIEEMAMKDGIPLEAAKNSYEQQKKIKEFENERAEAQRTELIGRLESQAEKLAENELFDGIDYDESLQNQDFVDTLASVKYDLEKAYRLHYFDQIMANKAKAVKDGITTNVQTRNNRPAENGTQDQAGANFKRKAFKDMSIDEMEAWANKNK